MAEWLSRKVLVLLNGDGSFVNGPVSNVKGITCGIYDDDGNDDSDINFDNDDKQENDGVW